MSRVKTLTIASNKNSLTLAEGKEKRGRNGFSPATSGHWNAVIRNLCLLRLISSFGFFLRQVFFTWWAWQHETLFYWLTPPVENQLLFPHSPLILVPPSKREENKLQANWLKSDTNRRICCWPAPSLRPAEIPSWPQEPHMSELGAASKVSQHTRHCPWSLVSRSAALLLQVPSMPAGGSGGSICMTRFRVLLFPIKYTC